MALRKDTKARDFSKAVKEKIAERDSIDGCPCCVNCGKPAPGRLVWSNAHFISRAQGGLGIEQNVFTACFTCHYKEDFGQEQLEYREQAKKYLESQYEGWNEKNLYYDKWRN